MRMNWEIRPILVWCMWKCLQREVLRRQLMYLYIYIYSRVKLFIFGPIVIFNCNMTVAFNSYEKEQHLMFLIGSEKNPYRTV